MNKDTFEVTTLAPKGGKAKKRILRWNLGTLKHIGVLTKDDPFDFNVNFVKIEEAFRICKLVTYAGLLSNLDYLGEDQDFDEKDVDRWVGAWDLPTAVAIIQSFSAAMTLQPSGEEGANTQSRQAIKVA